MSCPIPLYVLPHFNTPPSFVLLFVALLLGACIRWPGGRWDIGAVQPPWDPNRPSIYGFVADLPDDADERYEPLPDEARLTEGSRIRWAPGAMDGVFGGSVEEEERNARVTALWTALEALLRRSSDANAAALYQRLTESSTLSVADALIERMIEANDKRPLRADRLREVALWLVEGAPDREPVKMGLVWLGLVAEPQDRNLMTLLGSHEEFSLYAIVALMRSQADPETAVWELAQRVHGWGRIHAIQRLADTPDPRIQAWLLREGAVNSVMTEYTAAISARTGRLHEQLQDPSPDPELLHGAGAVLQALVTGGPAEDITAYPEAPEAMEHYLDRLAENEPPLAAASVLRTLRGFLSPGGGAEEDADRWPPELRSRLLDKCDDLLAWAGWSQLVDAALEDPTSPDFNTAVDAAHNAGLDLWKPLLDHAGTDSYRWWILVETVRHRKPERFDELLDQAREILPLDDMASGPADELGLGQEFAEHSVLEHLMTVLEDHPGEGWDLVRAALRSPVIRLRHRALGTLEAWGPESWPAEAPTLLHHALREEPDQKVRETLYRLLAGG